MSAACSRLAITGLLLALPPAATRADAVPARFWITASAVQPIPGDVNAMGIPEIDLVKSQGTSAGEVRRLTIWAQPGRDANGDMLQLRNISLNIVSTAGLIDILDAQPGARLGIDVLNPTISIGGAPVRRFTDVRESTTINLENSGLNLTTLLPASIHPQIDGNPPNADKAMNLQGYNLVPNTPAAGVGIGPTPVSNDPTSFVTSAGTVWQLAAFTIQALGTAGEEHLHLQIGSSGISHAGSHTADTNVAFASPTDASASIPIYNAGLSSNQRNLTSFSTDLPELIIHVANTLSGDYAPIGAPNGRVEGADFLLWQRLKGTSNLAADGNGDGVVNSADLAVFKKNFGRDPVAPRYDSLPGDYAPDGLVDGGDFLAWQRLLGTAHPFADGDGDGVVGLGDLSLLQTRYGARAGAGSIATVALNSLAGGAFIAIPEPDSIAMLLVAAAAMFATSRWRATSVTAQPLAPSAVKPRRTGDCRTAATSAGFLPNVFTAPFSDVSATASVRLPIFRLQTRFSCHLFPRTSDVSYEASPRALSVARREPLMAVEFGAAGSNRNPRCASVPDRRRPDFVNAFLRVQP